MKPLRPIRLLVCGGRTATLLGLGLDPGSVYVRLVRMLNELSANGKRPLTIIHGGANGVDTMANTWCFNTNTPKLVFPVSKEDWERVGNIAGNLRNTKMLEDGKPDMCVAFPGGRGTADMVAKAQAAGLRVLEVKL